MIVLLHAYSRTNPGDALLFDLSVERIRRVAPGADIVAYALDAPSFHGQHAQVRQFGSPLRRLHASLIPAGFRSALTLAAARGHSRWGTLAKDLDEAQGVVAVGGAYLRGPTATSAAGVVLNHLPQLAAAAASGKPTVYLPQSIGPFKGVVDRWVRSRLAALDVVCARDDTTAMDLDGVPGLMRVPDLAVLEIAERIGSLPRGDRSTSVVVVGRRLPSVPRLADQLVSLADRTRVTFALQTTGDSSKSDESLYRQMGVQTVPMATALAGAPGVVVSVRLHGALQAILAGWPAIHLAYERKGWGAYEDLGLQEFVHSASSFDVARVAEQIEGLVSDPARYWALVNGSVPRILDASRRLDERLVEVLEGPCR